MNVLNKEKNFTWFAVFMVLISRFGLTLYTPSLPHIANKFHMPAASAQLTVIIYLVCLGFTQLIYIPLSAWIGRRVILLFGGFLFAIGTLIIIFSNTIDLLLIGRVFQGFGAGAAPMIMISMTNDQLLSKEKFKQLIMHMALFALFLPLIAPVIGGMIQAWSHWRVIFILLLIFTLIIELACWFWLKDVATVQSRLSIDQLFKQYAQLFKRKRFVGMVSCIVFLYSTVWIYLTVSPFVFQQQLGLSIAEYSCLLLMPALGFIVGTWLSMQLRQILTGFKLEAISFFLLLIAILTALLLIGLQLISATSLIICLMVTTFAVGLGFNALLVKALVAADELLGNAIAVFGFITMTGSGLFTILICSLQLNMTLGLSCGLLFSALFYGIILFLIRRTKPINHN